jgi:hypothetical protein
MKKKVLVMLSLTLAVFLMSSCAGNNDSNNPESTSSNCSEISGTYSGTSIMGNTNGTATINISNDCSASLSYDQGSMVGATEKGEITGSGDKYKFNKSDGGSYDLTISLNRVVLDGYNWQCIMTK